MGSVKKQATRYRVGDWVTFFFGPQKVKARVIEDRGPLGVGGRRIYRVSLAFDSAEPMEFEMPEDDLKPTTPPDQSLSRQVFSIEYNRQGETNNWIGTAEWRRSYRGLDFKGAATYSSARWEGGSAKEANIAIVTVLVESDPRFDDEDLNEHPEHLRGMLAEARELADEMFRVRHPEATIQHRDSGRLLAHSRKE
jgi:hypothetical protein